jgi:hypothetical protein
MVTHDQILNPDGSSRLLFRLVRQRCNNVTDFTKLKVVSEGVNEIDFNETKNLIAVNETRVPVEQKNNLIERLTRARGPFAKYSRNNYRPNDTLKLSEVQETNIEEILNCLSSKLNYLKTN